MANGNENINLTGLADSLADPDNLKKIKGEQPFTPGQVADDPSTPLNITNLINPTTGKKGADLSGLALTTRNEVDSLPKHVAIPMGNMGIGESKWDFDGGLTYDEAMDLYETRARRQSTTDKWANGLTKAVGKTLVNVAGGTVGMIYGAGDSLINLDFNKLFNNDVSNWLDDANEFMDQKLPNYYTRYEQEKAWYNRLGTANFWSDQFFNGMSFIAGAVLTELAYVGAGMAITAATGGAAAPAAGAGIAANTARIANKGKTLLKGWGKAAAAKQLVGAAKAIGKDRAKWQALKLGRQIVTGAGYEAGVEARAHYDHLKETLIQDWKVMKGRDLTEEELLEIENIARSSSNNVFAGNLLLVGGSNMLMFGKLYGPGYALQNSFKNTIKKITPNFMSGVSIVGKGAEKTATAGFRTNRVLKTLGMGQKWQQRANKVASRTTAALGVPLYEGFVEEGGQSMIDTAFYDYNLSKYGLDGRNNVKDLWDASVNAFKKTYGSDEGMTEVMLGFLMGAIGIPGMGGNIVATHGRLKDVRKKENLQDFVADYYNKNKDLFKAMKSNADFMAETHELNALMDRALADNNIAAWKDLENDQIFSYVKSKIMTDQFSDIASDAESIRQMSDKDFMEFFGYSSENFDSASDISARKNQVADSIIDRAKKIKKSYEIVDQLHDFTDERWSNDQHAAIRDRMAHDLAVIDNVDERMEKLENRIAELTNGVVRETSDTINNGAARTIEYTTRDKNGNKVVKSFTIGDFTTGSLLFELKKIDEILAKDKIQPLPGLTEEETRAAYQERRDQLRQAINTDSGSPEINLGDLSPQEMELLMAFEDQLNSWKAQDETGVNTDLKEVIQSIKDLRHLRGRKQEFVHRFNQMAYGKNYKGQFIQEVESYVEDLNKDFAAEGILDPEVKQLFNKYGTTAKFRVGGVFYRFTEDGTLIKDGDKNATPVDPSILKNISVDDIITDSQARAQKVLEAIDELKKEKGREVEKILRQIEETEKEVEGLIDEIVDNDLEEQIKTGRKKGKFISTREIKKVYDKNMQTIELGFALIEDLQKSKDNLLNELEYIESLINTHYDPVTKEFVTDPANLYDATNQMNVEFAQELGILEELTKNMTTPLEMNESIAVAKEIRQSIEGWAQQNEKVSNIIGQKLDELRSYRDVLEKTLISRLRETPDLNIRAYPQASTMNDLYLDILNDLDLKVTKILNEEAQANVPAEKRIGPSLKLQLDVIIGKVQYQKYNGLPTYEEYKRFIKQNPNFLQDLNALGLYRINEVEDAFENARWLRKQITFTDNEIAEYDSILKQLRSVKDQSDVDQQLAFANALEEASKYQQAIEDVLGKMIELETKVLKPKAENQKDKIAGKEKKQPALSNPPSGLSQDIDLIDNNLEKDEDGNIWFRPDILTVGFLKTAGNHAQAIEDYENLSIVDENGDMAPKEGLSEQDLLKRKNAKSQLIFYKATEQFLDFRKTSKDRVGLMAITSENIPEELKEELKGAFYDTNKKQFNDKGSLEADFADIKLVMVDKDGTPVKVDDRGVRIKPGETGGHYVYSTMMTPFYAYQKGHKKEGNPRFTNRENLSESNLETKEQEHRALRQSILDNKTGRNIMLPIVGYSKGYMNIEKGSVFPVKGRAVKKRKQLKDVDILIATKVFADGTSEITTPDGTASKIPAPGFAYTILNGMAAPLKVRTLNDNEVERVVNLLRLYETNKQNLIKAGEQDVIGRAGEIPGIPRTDTDIFELIRQMVHFGPNTKKYDPKFRFGYDSSKDGYYYGENGFIDSKLLLDNDAEAIGDFKNFLFTKYHQIHKPTLDKAKKSVNKKTDYTPFVMVDLNSDLTVRNKMDYSNYTEYLLEERQDGSQPPVQTSVALIDGDYTAPQTKYRYIKFKTSGKKHSTVQSNIPLDEPVNLPEGKYSPHPIQLKSIQETQKEIQVLKNGQVISIETDIGSRKVNPTNQSTLNSLDLKYQLYSKEGFGQKVPENVSFSDYLDKLDTLFEEYKQDSYTVPFDEFIYHKDNGTLETVKLNSAEYNPNTAEQIKQQDDSVSLDYEDMNSRDMLDLLKDVEQTITDIQGMGKSKSRKGLMDDINNNDLNVDELNVDDEVNMAVDAFEDIVVEERPIEKVQEEIKKAKEMLPWNDIKLVTGFIKGNSPYIVGQVRGKGRTLVSNLGPAGVAYHETFHQVSLYVLPKETREKMYTAVKKQAAKKNISAEEYLAEEFRKWINSNGQYKKEIYSAKKKGIIAKAFDVLKRILRNLLGLDNRLRPDAQMESVAEVFQNIKAGKYATNSIGENAEYKDEVANMALLPDSRTDEKTSARFSMDLLSTLTRHFGKAMFDNPETAISIRDLEMLSDPNRKSEFNKKIVKVYKNAMESMYKEYTEIAKRLDQKYPEGSNEKADIMISDISNTLNYFRANVKNLMDVHRLYLNNLGLQTDATYDKIMNSMELTELDRKKDIFGIYESMEFSSITTSHPILKLLIGTLPGEFNSTFSKGTVDFNSTMSYLGEKLAGTTTLKQQIRALEGLKSRKPWIQNLLDRINTDLEGTSNFTFDELRLHNIFHQQFAQTKNNFLTYLIDDDGKFYSVNSNQITVGSILTDRWSNNLKAKASEEKGIVYIDKAGSLRIDLNHKINFDSVKLKKSINDFIFNKKDERKWLEGPAAIEFLQAFGMEFSNPREMLESNEQIDGKSIPNIIRETVGWILNSYSNNPSKNGADIYSRDSLDIKTRLGNLVQAELLFNDDVIEHRHFNAEGKPIYGITLNSYISKIANQLNTGNIPGHLNNIYTTNSLVLNTLKDKGGKVDISVIEGLRTRKQADSGSLTAQLSPQDRMAVTVNALLKDRVMPILRTADAATEYGVSFPWSLFRNVDAAKDILRGYLLDEALVAQNLNKNQVGEDINLFRENAKDLRVFKDIVALDPILKQGLKEAIEGNLDLETFITNNASKIHEVTKLYLQDQAEEIIKLWQENRIVDENGKNNAIDTSIIKKFIPSATKTDFLTQTQLLDLAEIFAVNDFIGSIEQTKLFFGDLALYKDLYKRTKGASGTKKYARVDSYINEWLNKEENRRRDNKIVDGTANVAVLDDPNSESRYINEYEYYLGNVGSLYRNIPEADANAWANMHFYREALLRVGDWSDQQESLYKKMFDPNQENLTVQELTAFPTLKPQYFGPQVTGENNSPTAFMKFSLTPLFPQMSVINGERTQLADLMDNMNETHTDIVIHPSGMKIGHKVDDQGLTPPFYNEAGLINKIDPDMHSIIDLSYFGIQLDISPKPKSSVTAGVQSRIHIMSNYYAEGTPIDFPGTADEWNALNEESKLLNSPVHKRAVEYTSLLNEFTKRSKQDLLNRLNIEEENGKYSLKDGNMSKFTEAIQDEIIKRKWPENIAEGVNYLLQQGKGERVFDILTSKDRIENLLFSMIGNNVIRQKYKGDLKVQVSSTGFEVTNRVIKQGKLLTGDPLNVDESRLKFYHKDPNNPTKTLGMEVYMPHYFKEYFGENVEIRPNGLFNEKGQKIGDNSLLDIIGYRTPTDGKHSIEFIKVKGFLPESAGPIVVVPSEITIKAGSDFDIDKLTLYFPSYRTRSNGYLVRRSYLNVPMNEEGLQQHYNNIYGPTLSYFKELDRELAETSRNKEEDTIYDPTSENLVKSIFGEDVLDYSEEEIDVLLKRFSNKENLSPRKREDFVIKEYKELKKRKDQIPSFSEFKKQNKNKTAPELNHIGAIQNRIMEIMQDVLSEETSYEQLLNPIGIRRIGQIADVVRGLKNEPTREDKNKLGYAQLISYPHKYKVSTEMMVGKEGLGIAAVNATHHIKSQLANLFVDHGVELEQYGDLFKVGLHFEGFETSSDGGMISLSLIKDSAQGNINDVLSELVNAFADVSDDPVILDLNFVKYTAPTAYFLLRAGVPIERIVLFLNQPIIKEYVNERFVNSSRFLNANNEAKTPGLVTSSLLEKYSAKDASMPATPILFSDKRLMDMIGKSYEELKASHAGRASENYLNDQLQILNDFRMYDAVGTKLTELTIGTTFDTKAPKSRNHARLLVDKGDRIIKDGTFRNAEKLLSNTYVGEFRKATVDSISMFKDFFLTELEGVRYQAQLDKIFEIYSNPKIMWSEKRRLAALNEAENDFITSALTNMMKDENGEILYNKIEPLFQGINSLPKQIADLQKTRYRTNPFIQGLLPILDNQIGDFKTTSNLKYFQRILNTTEKNLLRDAFMELPEKLQSTIIEFGILQSGLSTSNVSFLKLIPNELYAEKAIKIVPLLRTITEGSKNKSSINFYNDFFKNNATNANVVPRVPFNKRQKTQIGMRTDRPFITLSDPLAIFPYLAVTVDAVGRQEAKQLRDQGVDVPKTVKLWKKAGERTFKSKDGKTVTYFNYMQSNQYGNGKFLKEYPPSGEASVIPSNISGNSMSLSFGQLVAKPLPRAVSLDTWELERIMEKGKTTIAVSTGKLKSGNYELGDGVKAELTKSETIMLKDLRSLAEKNTFARRLGYTTWDTLVSSISKNNLIPKGFLQNKAGIDVFTISDISVPNNPLTGVKSENTVVFKDYRVEDMDGWQAGPLGGPIAEAVRQEIGKEIDKHLAEGKRTFLTTLNAGVGLLSADVLLKKQRALSNKNETISIIGVEAFQGQSDVWSDPWKDEYNTTVRRLKSISENSIITRKGSPKTRQQAISDFKSRDIFMEKNATVVDIDLASIKETMQIAKRDEIDSKPCN